MDEKERLVKAEQSAALLASDVPLEEIMMEAIGQVEIIRRRLKRFQGA